MSTETKEVKEPKNTNIIPAHLRGRILGSVQNRVESRIGRKPTNKEYGIQNGISTRQASKKRRGY